MKRTIQGAAIATAIVLRQRLRHDAGHTSQHVAAYRKGFAMDGLDTDGLVVIVGGSGFIGRYLVQDLARTGVRMRIVARNIPAAQFLKPLGGLGQIDIVYGDVRDPASLRSAMRGATAAVNLAGILTATPQIFDAVHARGAELAARAAAEAGAGRFVHVSAIGADRESPAAYARSKAAGEAAVRAAFPAATIVRPSVVFGREDAFLNRFAGLAQSMLPVMPVIAGATKFQPVYVGDVARAIATALGDPRAFGGRIFELGGPRTYSFRELLAWIMDEVRARKPLFDVPDSLAAMMAQLSGWLPGVPITRDQWAMLQTDTIAHGDGLSAFGIAATPMEAIAPAYLERFRTAGRFHREAAI
jgi:uncharacterized protein YbjT (DUF2867 family)